MYTALTDYEVRLVGDPEVLLAKNRIIQKVCALFGGLSNEYRSTIDAAGLAKEFQIEGKISRGENYKGLPYVVLDYPRQFGKQDVLAIRTFFWWGNFFSITLQLAGRYQQLYQARAASAIASNLFNDWYLGCSDDPWQHHFERENYSPVIPGSHFELPSLRHIKIAKKIPLQKWDDAEIFLKTNFAFLIDTLVL